MFKQNLFTLLIFLLAASLFSLKPSNHWKEKVDASVLNAFEQEEVVEFIVRFKEQADLSASKNMRSKNEKGQYAYDKLKTVAESSQAKIIAVLDAAQVDYKSYWVTNVIRVKSNQTMLQYLANQTEVEAIDPNPWVQMEMPQRLTSNQARSPQAIEWGIENINADQVWAMGHTGENIVIGGQDTGYDWTHPALEQKYRGYTPVSSDHNYNWHDAIHELNPLNAGGTNPCGLEVEEPCDDGSHGTHTMGTMVGDDNTGNQIGVAPGAEWIACRCMERGWGTPTTYMECFQWFIAPTDLNDENADPSKAPHVINNSWACPEIEGCNTGNFAMMETVVNNLKAAGIVVVVSAGNSGSDCETVSNPAAIFENSFTIGATDINDDIAGFSSRGHVTVDGSNRLKPNVTAPGVSVRSSIPGPDYAEFSGTSMSGPHVAGAVALILSAYPDLIGDVEGVEDILEGTALPLTNDLDCGGFLGADIPNPSFGYGRIDVFAAVDSLLSLSTSIEDQNLEQLAVFPNPFGNQLNIDLNTIEGDFSIQLYNSSGQLMYSTNQNHQAVISINTKSFASGVYLYKISDNQGTRGGKLIKF